MMTRLFVFAVLCGAVGCSSPTGSNNNDPQNNDDGCDALKIAVAMQCVDACGSARPGPAADAGANSDSIIADFGSNAPPAPDIGIDDPPEPVDMGQPVDFGSQPDTGTQPDAGFEYADFCELTLNEDGTISEWHGDNEESGTWSCSDGVVRVDNQFSGRQSYVLGDDGCLAGGVYSFK